MNKQRNIHRSTQYWQSILQAFDSSGLTQEVFSKTHHLAPSTFAKWKKQLKETTYSTSADFIEVTSKPQASKPLTQES